MRTRQTFLIGAGVLLSLLFMAIVFTPYLVAGNEKTDDKVATYIRQLQDEDAGVRLRAALSLGALGDPRAVEPLIMALQDDVEGVRMNAASA